MKTAVHLLDDFAMGGVMRALGLFDEPELQSMVASRVEAVPASTRFAARYEADLIVLHMPPSWRRMPWLLSLRARNPDARIVHVEHSYTRSFEHHKVSHVRRFRAMLRAAFLLVDEVACVSHAQRQWLIEVSGTAADKFRTIHPWSGRDDLLELDLARPTTGKPLHLVAYGRFAEVKNFGPLVEAVAALGPQVCHLSLGGSGPLENELAAAANGAGNISLAGQVEDVAAFLSAADSVIVPSLYEAFGLVATEARLAGRPVLVADVDGLPEQVGRGGMVARCDTATDIADAITRFLELPLKQMAREARQSARKHRADVVAGWTALITSE